MQISAKYNDEVYNAGTSTAPKTESAWIYDFRSGMDLGAMGYTGARAYLNVDNLFDKQYIASSHNYGVRQNNHRLLWLAYHLTSKHKIFYIVLR